MLLELKDSFIYSRKHSHRRCAAKCEKGFGQNAKSVNWKVRDSVNISEHGHAEREEHVRQSGRHVNKWPGADLGSHGESAALLCKAPVSSLTRPLNMVHRWLIKPCVSDNYSTH